MQIGNIGNYYGNLIVKSEEGSYYWCIPNWDGEDWQEITKDLYDSLIKFELGDIETEETVVPDDDRRHGGPYDRGSADDYYHRPFSPHYYEGATGQSPRIEEKDMTKEQIAAYTLGYEENDDKKDWG